MERRASVGKPSRRREPAWKGKPALPWKSNREPRNALRDLLGKRGDALGDQLGAWERLGAPPGKPWDAWADQPGAWERLGEPAGKLWGRLARFLKTLEGLGTGFAASRGGFGSLWEPFCESRRSFGRALGPNVCGNAKKEKFWKFPGPLGLHKDGQNLRKT